MFRGTRKAVVVVGLLGAAVVLSAQVHFKDTEWPTHSADLAGSRYRPLDQINASNFNKLEIAWHFKTESIGNRPEFKLEGTPLMINGVLYATAGSRRAAVALDASTGELLWVHGEHEGARGAAAPRRAQECGRNLAAQRLGPRPQLPPGARGPGGALSAPGRRQPSSGASPAGWGDKETGRQGDKETRRLT